MGWRLVDARKTVGYPRRNNACGEFRGAKPESNTLDDDVAVDERCLLCQMHAVASDTLPVYWPVFFMRAVAVAGYAIGALPIGSHGWWILDTAAVIGNAIIWWGSERFWGGFSDQVGCRRELMFDK